MSHPDFDPVGKVPMSGERSDAECVGPLVKYVELGTSNMSGERCDTECAGARLCRLTKYSGQRVVAEAWLADGHSERSEESLAE
jgi:hypothetical protein